MKIRLLVLLLATFATVASAQTVYNRFGPATGVLVGDTATPITSAADSTDIVGLWTGTCDDTTFLRADGQCESALTGTVSVANGGTGATSLSGILLGDGTDPVTSAASTDVIGLWSGTCNSGTFLRGDGSCVSPGSGSPGGADTNVQYNDAGSFGGDAAFTFNDGTGVVSATGFSGGGGSLTGLNGSNISSGTVADARLSSNVPLLSAPSNGFSGSTNGGRGIRITNSSGGASAYVEGVLLNDASNGLYAQFTGSGWTGGAIIVGGPTGQQAIVYTSGGSVPLSLGTAGTERIRIAGDGSLINLKATDVQVNGVSITPASGGGASTCNGFSGVSTCNVHWQRVGATMTCVAFVVSGTSDATTFTITGIPNSPAAPDSSYNVGGVFSATDNSVRVFANGFTENNAGSLRLTFNVVTPTVTSWTAGGAKGISGNLCYKHA